MKERQSAPWMRGVVFMLAAMAGGLLPAAAHAATAGRAGRLSLGLNLDLVNLGPGPTAVYGFTDRVYAQASLGGIGGPFGMEVKGGYLFSDDPSSFYAGFGLRNVSKDANAEYYSGIAPKGTSGFILGGYRFSLFGDENTFSEYIEGGYSIFHEKQTVKAGGLVEPSPILWHFASGIMYRFDWDLTLPSMRGR